MVKLSDSASSLRTVMAVRASVAGLTVAQARHGIAASVAVPTVTHLCTVLSPVTCITRCPTEKPRKECPSDKLLGPNYTGSQM